MVKFKDVLELEKKSDLRKNLKIRKNQIKISIRFF